MDVERVPDAKRFSVSDRRVKGPVKPALDMFQRLSYLADGGPTLIGEFEAGQIPAKEFDTPVLLKCFHLPADIGVAGMETLGGPNEVSFFREDESTHKSLSGDMGEHASPETSPNIGEPVLGAHLAQKCIQLSSVQEGEISRKKIVILLSPPLFLGRKEEFGNGLFQGTGQAFEAVEGRATLAPLDEIEKVERDRCPLRKLLLGQVLRLPDFAQPCAEVFTKSAHLCESS
jgi:hypothetical protein